MRTGLRGYEYDYPKTPEDPYIRLAKRLVGEAMYSAHRGNLSDAFWLVSDDAQEIIAAAEVEREQVLRFVAKVLIGEARLPKRQPWQKAPER